MAKGYLMSEETKDGVGRVLADFGYTENPAWRKRHSRGRSGDTYSGCFKIKDTSSGETLKVKVIDGANEAVAYCGYVNIGLERVPVLTTEITVTEPCVIYLETVSTTVATIKMATALPIRENSKDIKLIGEVDATNGVIVSIIQRYYGGDYDIAGRVV